VVAGIAGGAIDLYRSGGTAGLKSQGRPERCIILDNTDLASLTQ